MSRRTSEIIRFEVLKLLREAPTYGYNLFLLLKDNGIVEDGQRPDIYKILRTMKEKGFIQEVEEDKPSDGRKKVILSLTDKGLEEYYDRVIESANLFIDIMMNATFQQTSRILSQALKEFGYDSEKFRNKKVYFDPPVFNLNLIKTMLRHNFISLDVEVSIYIKPKKHLDMDFFHSFEKSKVSINVIDENLSIKPKSMDIIYVFSGPSKKILQSKLSEYVEFLAPEGVLFLFAQSPEKHERPQMFENLMKDTFSDLPKKYRERFAEFLPPMSTNKKEGKITLKNEEIQDLLSNLFGDVQIIKDLVFLEVFIAKNIKNGD